MKDHRLHKVVLSRVFDGRYDAPSLTSCNVDVCFALNSL